MVFKRAPFLALLCLLAAAPALAVDLPPQATERVAASVNLEAITLRDLDSRVRLVLLSISLPDTPENRNRVAGEILRRLIDEHLETQEAARLKIEIQKAETDEAVAELERQNHMAPGKMAPYLESQGIDAQTLRDQLTAQLAWSKVVRAVLMPEVRVGEEEIDSRLRTIRESIDKPTYLVSDIFLPVDSPQNDAQIKDLSEKLFAQLKAGVAFGTLASQFSRSGAVTGGDLGWVTRGMVDDAVYAEVEKMQPGQAAPPLRTADGYHILMVRGRHAAGEGVVSEPTLDLASVDLISLPSDSEDDRKGRETSFVKVVSLSKSCDDLERDSRSVAAARFTRLGLVRPSDTPDEVRTTLIQLKPGEVSPPERLGEITRYFMVCARTEASKGMPTREEVRRRIEGERLELRAQRYLRDLRRAAFVEVRL